MVGALYASILDVAPRRGACVETASFASACSGVYVAPRRGACVETSACTNLRRAAASHPAGVRVLKPMPNTSCAHSSVVAPRRGACVETCLKCRSLVLVKVAPRRGACVETRK